MATVRLAMTDLFPKLLLLAPIAVPLVGIVSLFIPTRHRLASLVAPCVATIWGLIAAFFLFAVSSHFESRHNAGVTSEYVFATGPMAQETRVLACIMLVATLVPVIAFLRNKRRPRS
jgi:hypothetical protein